MGDGVLVDGVFFPYLPQVLAIFEPKMKVTSHR